MELQHAGGSPNCSPGGPLTTDGPGTLLAVWKLVHSKQQGSHREDSPFPLVFSPRLPPSMSLGWFGFSVLFRPHSVCPCRWSLWLFPNFPSGILVSLSSFYPQFNQNSLGNPCFSYFPGNLEATNRKGILPLTRILGIRCITSRLRVLRLI